MISSNIIFGVSDGYLSLVRPRKVELFQAAKFSAKGGKFCYENNLSSYEKNISILSIKPLHLFFFLIKSFY